MTFIKAKPQDFSQASSSSKSGPLRKFSSRNFTGQTLSKFACVFLFLLLCLSCNIFSKQITINSQSNTSGISSKCSGGTLSISTSKPTASSLHWLIIIFQKLLSSTLWYRQRPRSDWIRDVANSAVASTPFPGWSTPVTPTESNSAQNRFFVVPSGRSWWGRLGRMKVIMPRGGGGGRWWLRALGIGRQILVWQQGRAIEKASRWIWRASLQDSRINSQIFCSYTVSFICERELCW